jgi:hypothetical protein
MRAGSGRNPEWRDNASGIDVLARLDLNGPAHHNPPESPYQPGQRIAGAHMHMYREDFEDRIAYELADVPGLLIRDLGSGVSCLEDFFRFVGLREWPAKQLSI